MCSFPDHGCDCSLDTTLILLSFSVRQAPPVVPNPLEASRLSQGCPEKQNQRGVRIERKNRFKDLTQAIWEAIKFNIFRVDQKSGDQRRVSLKAFS